MTIEGLNERIEVAKPHTLADSNDTDWKADDMTATRSIALRNRPSLSVRRTGYVVAIVMNLLLLYVANNLLDWNVLSFLTAAFGSVVWLINLSLAGTILANVVWLGYDVAWFKALSQIGLNLISAVVSIRMYQVFPFDFSQSQFDWAPITRLVIIFTLIGLVLATIAELVKLARPGPPSTRSPARLVASKRST